VSLSDERRSRRFRDRALFDPMTFRVFLALVGAAAFAIAGLGYIRATNGLSWLEWMMFIFFVSLGIFLIAISFFAPNKVVAEWGDLAMSFTLIAMLMLAAYPLAWAIRKVFRFDTT
jgi:hypothetical protein